MTPRTLAGLRCLVFLGVVIGLTLVLFFGAVHIPFVSKFVYPVQSQAGMITSWGIIAPEIVQLSAIYLAAFMVVYGQKGQDNLTPWWHYFLHNTALYDTAWWRHFVQGLFLGCGCITAIIAVITLCYGYTIRFPEASWGISIFRLTAYGVTFLLVSLTEELLFRSYLYVQLKKYFGFSSAAVITSILFGLAHAIGGTPLWGAVGAGIVGYIFCLMLRATGSLSFPIGFHAAWDWTQTAFFGVNDSGHAAYGALLNTNAHGVYWLTGGQDGPEASVVSFIVYILLIVYYRVKYLRSRCTNHTM